MWKFFVIVCLLILEGCKKPESKSLDKAESQNISINFKVDYQPIGAPYSGLAIWFNMNNEKGSHIEVGTSDEMRVYLNGTEYLLEQFHCSSMYGHYFCGYRFPYLSDEQVANLTQPLTITLEIIRNNDQLITATASLPYFLTMTSSISAEKKYDPLSDVLQISWMSSVPVKQVEYFADQYANRSCGVSILKNPQPSDTYVQFNPNELGLDTNFCQPMSHVIVAVEAMESVTAMQTNVVLAAANIRLNQRVFLYLLREPYVEEKVESE